MQQGKILDYWKSYARDVCPLIFYFTVVWVIVLRTQLFFGEKILIPPKGGISLRLRLPVLYWEVKIINNILG
uniref:Unclassified n=1 Tax=Fusarium pseudograminearum CS3220 TaxID=1318456 RepID=W1I9Z4_FUSPS|nr:unclassified [Fusarium pseudograminearum CS3220]CDX48478.1 unclassified [Fusarium pseudograminearum CS3220]